MTTQQSYNLSALQRIELLASKFKAFLASKDVKAILDETPKSLTKGKDIYQIGMQDIQQTFEFIYKERALNAAEIPLNVYKAILRHSEPSQKFETNEQLLDYFQKRRDTGEISKYFFENNIPLYLRVLYKRVSPQSLEKLADEYMDIVDDITQAGVDSSLQNSLSKNADLKESIETSLNELYDEITAPENVVEFERGDAEPSDDDYDALYKADGADPNYQEYADSEDQQNTTVLSPDVEQFLKLYGQNVKDSAQEKYQARREFCKNMGKDINDNRYTPVDEGLLDVAETLMMTPTQSSVVMVAEKGMDTSGIVTRLAEQLYHDDVPEKLSGARIIELDLEKMITYLSQTPDAIADPDVDPKGIATSKLESNLHALFTDIDKHNKSGKSPIFLSLKGFEQAVKPKPVVGGILDKWFTYWLGEDKDVRIIAEISNSGIESVKKDAPDLYKILNTYKIKAPTEKEISARIKDWAYYGRGKLLTDKYIINADMIDLAVKLSNKHINLEDEAQPGLTASILTLAATAAEMRHANQVNEDDIINAIMTRSGKSRDMIQTNQNQKMKTLNGFVKENLINQDHAVDVITKKFDRVRRGQKKKGKPIGVFMLTGPTGVGKTEIAKLIAEHLGAGFIPVDMSNYSSEHTVSQILGSPPGYVGFQGRTVLEDIENNDINVVLLDEFEKCHDDIFKPFMSAFDEARMVLRHNKKLNFENTLFLLTSNIGEKQKAQAGAEIGFGASSPKSTEDSIQQEAIDKKFPPEFKNRVDGYIQFNDLNRDALKLIAKIKIAKFTKTSIEDGLLGDFDITDDAMEQLIDMGHIEGMGARPLERAIETAIENPIGDWLDDNEDKDPTDYKFEVTQLSPSFEVNVTSIKDEPQQAVDVSPTNDNNDKPSAPRQKIV